MMLCKSLFALYPITEDEVTAAPYLHCSRSHEWVPYYTRKKRRNKEVSVSRRINHQRFCGAGKGEQCGKRSTKFLNPKKWCFLASRVRDHFFDGELRIGRLGPVARGLGVGVLVIVEMARQSLRLGSRHQREVLNNVP